MSATIYAYPNGDAPLVGAICDTCQENVVEFDSVAFGSDYLTLALEVHDCRGDNDG